MTAGITGVSQLSPPFQFPPKTVTKTGSGQTISPQLVMLRESSGVMPVKVGFGHDAPACISRRIMALVMPRFRKAFFGDINSIRLLQLESNRTIARREDFPEPDRHVPPPLIGKSSFVSRQMVEHLMRDKKNLALALKRDRTDLVDFIF